MTLSFEQFSGIHNGTFRAISADPPWKFSAGTKGRPQHYPRMTLGELEAMRVRDLMHPDGAWLFLWSIPPMLPHALHLMKAWGFRYTSVAFTWAKTNPTEQGKLFFDPTSFALGTGYTTRKQCEYCLLGRRGKPQRKSKAVRELMIAARREHSRKPDQIYERIEEFSAGPYCELFGRNTRRTWTVWGNEIEKFGEVA
jgi:N6-adenosine-specific RNA methylase IME4